MSWQDFEDYEAEIWEIIPDLSHAPYVTMTIVECYKSKKTSEMAAAEFFRNPTTRPSMMSQTVTLSFDTDEEAERFHEAIQTVTTEAKHRMWAHVYDEQKGKKEA